MMKQRLFDGGGQKTIQRRSLEKSRTQEADVAKKLDGKTVVGSGSKWYAKSDVKTKEWLIECKRTDKKSYTLKKEEVEKAIVQAMLEGREMMFQVEIGELKLALITLDKFIELTEVS